jgi:DnaD and phage-associated domain
MEEMEILQKLLKKNPIIFIELLLDKQVELNFSAVELIVLQYLWLEYCRGNESPSNQYLATIAGLEANIIRQTIATLIAKNTIQLLTIKENGKVMESYNLFPIINKCFEKKVMSETSSNGIKRFVNLAEQEFCRTLSPFEIDYIHTLVYDQNIDFTLLEEALKETVLSGSRNFKYMTAIIHNWQQGGKTSQKYGIKNNSFAIKELKEKNFSQEEKEIASLDWSTILQDE